MTTRDDDLNDDAITGCLISAVAELEFTAACRSASVVWPVLVPAKGP